MTQDPGSTGLYDARIEPTDQRDAFTGGDVPVAVYGLGKMGLPIAAVFAEVTGTVIGADVDERVVDRINAGDCPVSGEPGLADAVATAVDEGSLRATAAPAEAASAAAIHVVIVPTLLDEDDHPDLAAVEAVAEAIGSGLAPGDAVFVESTVPPGTCRDLVDPLLAEASGLATDTYGLAFCPERTASGQALEDIRGSYPKIVGGRDDESTRVARLVYDELTHNRVIPVSDPSTAECVKVFEGLYRDVNIALANELAGLADEHAVDVREAITAANTQPFCDIHDPGPGVGGHCIPYYPHFVLHGETPLPLVSLAREINDAMPIRTADRIETELERVGVAVADATVVLLGITYRPGIDETRASPTYPMAAALTDRGADVYAVDPVCSDPGALDATVLPIDRFADVDPDAVALVTGHDAFADLPWEAVDDAVVIDGRDFFDGSVGLPTYTIGRGRTVPGGSLDSAARTDAPASTATDDVTGRDDSGDRSGPAGPREVPPDE